MSASLLDPVALQVLAAYPAHLGQGRVLPLGNRGGFSGARLWRLDGPAGSYCLRAWPEGDPSPDRLHGVHHLMRHAREAGLEFVPHIVAASSGTTWVEQAGRLWDMTTWLPGQADFHAAPEPARLEAACFALARLHAAWASMGRTMGPCPGVQRRLQHLGQWQALVASGWRPLAASADPAGPSAVRAWQLLQQHQERIPRLLAPWISQALPLQPCLCDVWHDHLLFSGNVLTGLVDYGGVKLDHVAVDLARLLGSMAGDDQRLRRAGLEAYARLRPLALEEEALVGVLDETGTLLAVATWLRWLYWENRPLDDRAAAAARLASLVARIEQWRSGSG